MYGSGELPAVMFASGETTATLATSESDNSDQKNTKARDNQVKIDVHDTRYDVVRECCCDRMLLSERCLLPEDIL